MSKDIEFIHFWENESPKDLEPKGETKRKAAIKTLKKLRDKLHGEDKKDVVSVLAHLDK